MMHPTTQPHAAIRMDPAGLPKEPMSLRTVSTPGAQVQILRYQYPALEVIGASRTKLEHVAAPIVDHLRHMCSPTLREGPSVESQVGRGHRSISQIQITPGSQTQLTELFRGIIGERSRSVDVGIRRMQRRIMARQRTVGSNSQ